MKYIPKILLNIDALFDLRMGTIRTYWPQAVSTIESNDFYWSRDFTDWSLMTDGVVDNDEFEQRYKSRTNEVLKNSRVTLMPAYLSDIIQTHIATHRLTNHDNDITIVINFYPFDISDVEQKLFIDCLHYYIGTSGVVIETAFLSQDSLTPEFLDEKFGGMITYDADGFLATHSEALMSKGLFGFDLTAPLLFLQNTRELSVDEKQKLVKTKRFVFHEFIALDFIDARVFSEAKIAKSKAKTEERETTDWVPKRGRKNINFE